MPHDRRLQTTAGGPDVTTADGRVALFTSLFRGRADVFATRWESTKSPGKTGWAPGCLNEWRPSVCAKPKVKCADCGNRRFFSWSDAEARRDLEGRQTAGIYPLLADETCWLVAVDLDGPGWREDTGALRDSAREMDIPVLVERSRSGRRRTPLGPVLATGERPRGTRDRVVAVDARDAPPIDLDGLL